MVLVDLVRRVSASAAGVLALALPAIAGDSAHFNAIGYSHDGRYFAFEQFGIQDGSGFPYADIVVIDLLSDSFAGGSPFRARINEQEWDFANESWALDDIRAEALAMAEPFLSEEAMTLPAIPLVLRGDGTLDDDGLAISYGVPTYGLAQTGDETSLSLDVFKAPSAQQCELFEGDPMGFALFRDEDERIELHRDARVPASRNCVITYKFYGVFNPFGGLDDSRAVAVLSVWSHGFEGPDRRFIALPVRGGG